MKVVTINWSNPTSETWVVDAVGHEDEIRKAALAFDSEAQVRVEWVMDGAIALNGLKGLTE
ncbi:MAG: hypothetical protein WEF28_01015 [Acidimicrobiia bacterium]